MQSRDGQRGRNFPDPVPLPWDLPEDRGFRGDVMTVEEAADWLGWSREMHEHFEQ